MADVSAGHSSGDIATTIEDETRNNFIASQWIFENFAPRPKCSLNVNSVYQEYSQVCRDAGSLRLNESRFGVFLRKCYPTVEKIRVQNSGVKYHAYAPFTKTPVSKYNSCHSLREMSDDEGWSFQDTKDSMKVFVADNETNCRAVFFQKEANGKVMFVSSVLNGQEVELSHNILQNLTSTDSYDKVCLGLRQYFSCKLCEGFKPNDENIVPNHNFMMNHHSNTVIATCNSQRQYHSLKCKVLVFPEEHKQKCNECYALTEIKNKVIKRSLIPKDDGAHEKKKQFVNNKVLSREELVSKLNDTTKKAQKAQKKIKSMQKKFEKEMIELKEEQAKAIKAIFVELDKTKKFDDDDDFKILWESQKRIMELDNKSSMRWHPKIIRMCLDVYSRSPSAYAAMFNSEIFKALPTARLLRMYKNCVKQGTGLVSDNLQWLMSEADKLGYQFGSPERLGGLSIDEVSIQSDLIIQKTGDTCEVIGMIELGKEELSMRILECDELSVDLATHVLQYIFTTFSGLRYPIAYYASETATASTYLIQFYKVVEFLLEGGFKTIFANFDGAGPNRKFLVSHFKNKDPVEEKFTTLNRLPGEPLVLAVDPSHNFKKIRNGLLQSRCDSKTKLVIEKKPVLWDHLYKFFTNDQLNPHPLNRYLTESHFNLTSSSKMRNLLANQVLDGEMLRIGQSYAVDSEARVWAQNLVPACNTGNGIGCLSQAPEYQT